MVPAFSRGMDYKSGDRNTKFYHNSTIIRYRRNTMDSIRNFNGDWITDPSSLELLVRTYFHNLFQQEIVLIPSCHGIDGFPSLPFRRGISNCLINHFLLLMLNKLSLIWLHLKHRA